MQVLCTCVPVSSIWMLEGRGHLLCMGVDCKMLPEVKSVTKDQHDA